MYRKINQQHISELEKILGSKNVIHDPEKMLDYSHDEFALPEISHMPEVVVKPESTAEIAEICKFAHRELVPLTPRGGGTGLCGGCVPSLGGIVLSLERMNRIIEIDQDNQMAVVEPGVSLMDFCAAVDEAGLFFPPHPGDESAMIGGLIATNAGGARAVKYGVIRNYVRGLEVVLASGGVIHPGGKLMKSSTGYSLLHLFIGSEGTLGVISQATIQLMPPPSASRSLIIPYDDLQAAIESVPEIMQRKILPLAVEFMPKEVISLTEKMLNKKWPCSRGSTHLLIILDAPNDEEMDRLSEKVADICIKKGALDVYVADNPQKQSHVLSIRSKIYESIKEHNIEVLDIVVPRGEIAKHMQKIQEAQQKFGLWLPTYGHAADGNVHTHIMRVRYEEGKLIPLPKKEWKDKLELVRTALFKDCRERGGMISGEHGVGIVKKPYLSYVLTHEEISLMQKIKKLFDPHSIMNPEKIFDQTQ